MLFCQPRAVFYKVRSADHFWSAEIFNLVWKNKNSVVPTYYKPIYYKNSLLCRKTCYFMVRWKLYRDFVVPQIFSIFYGPQPKKVSETLTYLEKPFNDLFYLSKTQQTWTVWGWKNGLRCQLGTVRLGEQYKATHKHWN